MTLFCFPVRKWLLAFLNPCNDFVFVIWEFTFIDFSDYITHGIKECIFNTHWWEKWVIMNNWRLEIFIKINIAGGKVYKFFAVPVRTFGILWYGITNSMDQSPLVTYW